MNRKTDGIKGQESRIALTKVKWPGPGRVTPVDILILGLAGTLFTLTVWHITIVLDYQWNWKVIPQYMLRFDQERGQWVPGIIMSGLITTLRLSLWTGIMAMVIGILMALAKTGKNPFLRRVAIIYVAIIRNIPVLVWILISYYFIADSLFPGMEMDALGDMNDGPLKSLILLITGPASDFPLFMAGAVSLAVYEGAYITEIVRAGIEGIDKGQWEASSALGFTYIQQMRHVILPQGFRTVVPALGGQLISTIKDSAVLSVISIPDLTFQGMELMAGTFLTFEIWITILTIYFIVCFSCSLLINHIENSYKKRHL
ncbi:MAG: amino acid ABC transporter permease [Desulfamplus sp.]|nr:amino acid ABC transporter permease [Desulfamplus sp.]